MPTIAPCSCCGDSDVRLRTTAGALGTLMAALLAASCSRPPTAGPPAEMPLYVAPSSRDFSDNPALLERIRASPHGYFRFVNRRFASEVCRRFERQIGDSPIVNLHGDAHVEQYAVTDLGRGLTDFDDSVSGPALIDLARFGVSLALALRQLGREDELAPLWDRFLEGYLAALADPGLDAPEPAFARQTRAAFTYDRPAYFAWIDEILEPLPQGELEQLLLSLQPYVEAMERQLPEPQPDFFDVVTAGYLRMGIGSALDLKYLARVRGASDDPLDDLVLEIKEVRDLGSVECIGSAGGLDPFRILIGQSRIAYEPYRYLGYIRHRGRTFWVHSWVDNYRELEIEDLAADDGNLAEIAFDVGAQLGRGHPNQIAVPLDAELRREQARLVARDGEPLEREVTALAHEVVAAWELFRRASADTAPAAASL